MIKKKIQIVVNKSTHEQFEEPIIRYIEDNKVLLIHKSGDFKTINKYYLESRVFETNKFVNNKYRFILIIDRKIYRILSLLKWL